MLEVVVVTAWTVPIVLAGMALLGYVRGRRLKVAFARGMIIQITTVGNQETVNAIIAAIRGYRLGFPHRIWVVTEPSSPTGYEGADRLIVVPADFECRASYKCRALEYVRRLRAREGLADRDLKILFLDDDSLPTKGYIEKAFQADHDICQGIVAPRNHYGRFLSYMDDLRTLNCLVFCSVFQSFGRPIQVHGEGLCVRASAEQVVTWDHPVVAS
jgi:Glycosyl transferase family group 2